MLKRIFYLALFAIVLVLLAFCVLKMTQWDNYAPLIERIVQQATGRTLTIKGPIHVTWHEHPIVSFEDIEFSNADWSPVATAASVKKLTIEFRVIPLFKKQIDLVSVDVESGQFLVQHDAPHVSNWQFEQNNQTPSSGFSMLPPSALNISLKNTQLTLQPYKGIEKKVALTTATLLLEAKKQQLTVKANGSVNKIGFQIQTTINYPNDLRAGLYQVNTNILQNSNRFILKGSYSRNNHSGDFQINSEGKNFADVIGLFATPYLQTDHYQLTARLRLTPKQFQFTGINAALLGGKITGDFSLDARQNVPAYHFDLVGRGLNAGLAMRSLELSPQFSGGKMYVHFQIDTQGSTAAEFLGHQTGVVTAALNHTYYKNPGLAVYTQKFFQLLNGGLAKQGADLDCLVTRLHCASGFCVIKGFAFNTAGANVVGKGAFNLKNDTMNLLFVPISKVANLNPLAIPVHVSGPFHNPSITPATQALTKQLSNDLFNLLTGKTVVTLVMQGLSPAIPTDQTVYACLGTLANFRQGNKSIPTRLINLLNSFNPLAGHF